MLSKYEQHRRDLEHREQHQRSRTQTNRERAIACQRAMEALTDQREQLAIRAIALIEDGQVPLTQLSKEGKFRRGRLMASQKFWEEAKAKADGKVRTYSRDFGDSVFSNMSMSCPFPIKLRKPDGRWYLSVEHAYVIAKLRSYRDHPKGAILDGNVGRCNRLLSTVAMEDPTGAKKAAKALIL